MATPQFSRIELTSPLARPAEVLVAAPLHPFPPRCGSAVRIAQYIRYLEARGAAVDLAVLSDAPSPERDLESAREALRHCSRVLVVRHPVVTSRVLAFGYRAWGRVARFRLGDWLHSPPRFVRAVRGFAAGRRYRAVIVSGVGLARLCAVFRPHVLRILEAQDVWYDRYRSYAALGRGAEFANFADPAREARLAARFDRIVAITERDAQILRSLGVDRPIAVCPFAADRDLLAADEAGPGAEPAEPERPPRILFVGTETSSNLDAVRFFRNRVFPAVRKQVPTARLRVVGLCAGHLDGGPGVDLVGWVDRLSEEYRAAACVAVPLRMGSGLKSKAVEALAHGKALLTTTVGAQGIDLVPGLHAVVSDDPAVLAREAAQLLTDDRLRRSYEEKARALAQRLFDPERALRPLWDLIFGRPRAERPHEQEASLTAEAAR